MLGEKKNTSNAFYEFIHGFADLIEPFIYLSFFQWATHMSDQKRAYSGYAHLCTCLKFLRHPFLFTSKTYMNLSRRLVFRTPRRPANVLELRTPKWVGFFGIFPKCSLQLFFRNPNGSVIFSTTLMVASGWMERRS